MQVHFEVECSIFSRLPSICLYIKHHFEPPHYERVLLIDGLLLVYLIYIYQLGGNWEAVITQDAVQRSGSGDAVLMSLERR